MTRRRIIIIGNVVAVIIVVVLVFLIWPRVQSDDPDQTPAPATTPAVVINQDVAKARLVPDQFANLSFVAAGIVEEILVEEGDDVTAGDPLVKLKAGEQENAQAQAQARLAAAEIDLAAAETSLATTMEDVSIAELAVTVAEANLALAKAGASPQEIAAAEQNVAAARSGVVQAGAARDASLQVPESQIRAAEADVAAARAEVEALQKSYDDIINTCFDGPDGSTFCPLYGAVEENTRAQLEAARLNLSAAQAALDALNAGASAGRRRAAAGAVTIAQANQEMAEAQLNSLLSGPSEEEVLRSELQVAQARAGVEQARAAVERAQATVSQAEVAVEIAQGDVNAAQTALDRMTLLALFPGTVSQVDVKIGQQIVPGAPVLTLADLEDWLLETTDLSERDIAQIEIGAPVKVTVDAISGEMLDGQIIDISRGFQSEGGEVIYQVTIDLEERADLPLRWGMSAEVDYGANS
ncbi:MAG: HlyD family efflux transporter periplasmic adaptor subunit [Chloroflexota bacterium]|nr:MAG: HlyD family efflux transporter periplasmic adaptor subunit [Chloroflexota bacterium]